MINILFVCHGNICRSPMAEFVMKDMVEKEGIADRFHIESAATSSEEIGNPPHYGTVNKLRSVGITVKGKHARRMTKKDYEDYDYLIGMDNWNIKNIRRIIGDDKDEKVFMLLDFTDRAGQEIADPWYTGEFDPTYRDVVEGCTGFLKYLKENHV